MKDEARFYSSCEFYIEKEGCNKKRLDIYSEAKNYGAIACLSEVLAIATDFIRENNKDLNIFFIKISDRPLCILSINLNKNKKSINNIKNQFSNIENRFIKVHNFKNKQDKYIVYLKYNNEMESNYEKIK